MGTGHCVQEPSRGTTKGPGYTGPPASFRRALPSQARTGQGMASNTQGYSLIPDGGGDIIPGTRLAYRAHSPLLPILHRSRVKPGLVTPTEDSSSFKHWALPMRTPPRFQIHHFITKLQKGKVKANSDLNTKGPEPACRLQMCLYSQHLLFLLSDKPGPQPLLLVP